MMNAHTRAAWKCAVFTLQCASLLQSIKHNSRAAIVTECMSHNALYLLDCMVAADNVEDIDAILQNVDNLALTASNVLLAFTNETLWETTHACA
jgi:hypothetical protein